MGAFEYVALDNAGREKKGVLEGDSPRQIRQLLREQQLLPLTVDEVAQKESVRSRGYSFQRGISATDLALLTRQLATLSRSGLPLAEATATVAKQTEKPRIKRILLGVRNRVVEGHSLAEGLTSFPHVFPEIYRTTVAAGEQSGHLDVVLERLADYTEARQELQQSLMQALLYPIILTVMALSIVSFLLAYVVPKVIQVFENTDQALPLLTRLLIGLSDFVRDYYLGIFTVVILAIVSFSALLKKSPVKRLVHRWLLRLPLIGLLIRGSNTARFTRTLSILAASGVPVLESLRIAGQVISNLPMRTAVETVAVRVREGASLAKSLDQEGYFPPMVVNLIASGESGGNLDEMLERAAVNQEREMKTRINMLMGLLEPLLLVAMGGVVLVIVMAILQPIFDMNQLIG